MSNFLRRYLLRKDFIPKAQNRVRTYIRYGYQDAFKVQARLLSGTEVKTIFDIGANVGDTVATYSHLFPEARIHAFEPTPNVYEGLKARFQAKEKIKIHPLAVGESEKETVFYMSKNGPNMNSIFPPQSQGWAKTFSETKVPMTALDIFCSENDISEIQIMKLDIQGGETAALRGASNLLSRSAIWSIYLECVIEPIYEKQPLIYDILNVLHEHEYVLFNFYNFRDSDSGRAKWCDALFISPKMERLL